MWRKTPPSCSESRVRSSFCWRDALSRSAAGNEIKINYATQVEINPPTIVVFCSKPALLQEHYVRYMHNGFRDKWGFHGSPLNIKLKTKAGRREE
jgi:predicted GTPase